MTDAALQVSGGKIQYSVKIVYVEKLNPMSYHAQKIPGGLMTSIRNRKTFKLWKKMTPF